MYVYSRDCGVVPARLQKLLCSVSVCTRKESMISLNFIRHLDNSRRDSQHRTISVVFNFSGMATFLMRTVIQSEILSRD